MSTSEIVPSYTWFDGPEGREYRNVWRVFIDGNQAGIWTRRRWAKRDLRRHLRDARRAARKAERQ
jgi:hypothetical protein